MRPHHRNYKFRPPRRRYDRKAASTSVFVDFLRRYLFRHKWLVTACFVLFGLNASAPFVIAYYTRLAVDEVLVVQEYTARGRKLANTGERVWASDHPPTSRNLPREGRGRRLNRDPAVSDRPPGAARRLWLLFGAFAGTLIILNSAGRIGHRIRVQLGRSVAENLREDMHAKVLNLSMSYHAAHTPGRLLSRIVSDVEIVQQHTMQALVLGSRSVVMITAGVVILGVVEWRVLAIVCLVLPVYAVVFKRARLRIRQVNLELRHTNSCMYGLTAQKLDGIKAIQAYGREKQEDLNFHRLAGCFLRDALRQQRLNAGLGRTAQIIQGMTTSGIFLFCTNLVLEGTMTVGRMLFVHATTASLFAPILQLTQLNLILTNLSVVVRRASDILNEPLEFVDAPDAVPLPLPLHRGITVRDVAFRYQLQGAHRDLDDAGMKRESPLVLSGVNLHVPAGSWLCVMGPSGGGKTTLLYLLARLYQQTQGQILFDGVPLNKIGLTSLRRAVGFVPQEARIFSGSIRDNICYAKPEATPDEIMAAARAAELHEFIMDLPVKYETLIGEKGMSLSGGQRQRLSLARALLTKPDILLLDDCTSALDAQTERRIQETLERIMENKTAVIVSQRVSMAKRCDRICTLENGVVTERGSHDALVDSGGFYARLHAQQTE